MEDQKKFHYEIKAPDRVFWHFRGTKVGRRHGGIWSVTVTQEYHEEGITFDMTGSMNMAPSLIDVFSAFQAKIGTLLNPIAWEIYRHGNTGME